MQEKAHTDWLHRKKEFEEQERQKKIAEERQKEKERQVEIEKERKEEAEKLRLAEEERKKEWQKKKEERYSFVLYVNVLNLTEIIANRIKSSRLEGVFDDNFSYFSSKPYVVTPSSELCHRDGSDEGSQHVYM